MRLEREVQTDQFTTRVAVEDPTVTVDNAARCKLLADLLNRVAQHIPEINEFPADLDN